MEWLTHRQSQVFEYIVHCIEVHGAPPTRAEIATYFGWKSPNAAEEHLRAIEKKGAITLGRGKSRNIRVMT